MKGDPVFFEKNEDSLDYFEPQSEGLPQDSGLDNGLEGKRPNEQILVAPEHIKFCQQHLEI